MLFCHNLPSVSYTHLDVYKRQGYGVVYFGEQMLKTKGETFKDKTVTVSGFGNVAWGVIKKVEELGGKAVTISGPDGYVYDKDGITGEKIDYLLELRASGNNRAEDYVKKYPSAEFHAGKRPWEVKCDVAIPSATQNELHLEDARKLVENGCMCVVEAANMPSTLDAINYFLENHVLFSPGKASNAGGAVSYTHLDVYKRQDRNYWFCKGNLVSFKENFKRN